jgi:hypothetical protein
MKILLVGEFSGLHRELKKGLIEIGHDATILAAGDGWKDFDCDIKIPQGKGLFSKIAAGFKQYKLIRSLRDYDVVQFIYPHIFNRIVNSFFINLLIRQNKRSFLIAAGSDAYYWENYKQKFRYFPHEENLLIDLKGKSGNGGRKWFKKWNYKMAISVNAIIPIAYDYRIGYEGFENLELTIPLPICLSDITPHYFDPEAKKIFLLHGISRPGFKGSKFIKSALDRLKEKYGDKIEILLPERISYPLYLEILSKADIVIDQALSYSYGMNALLAASFGKVTLSGAEPECLLELGVDWCPIINILPSSDDIFSKIDNLLSDRNLIKEISYKSRNYVENLHESKVVARRFMKTWSAYI